MDREFRDEFEAMESVVSTVQGLDTEGTPIIWH